MPLVIVKIGGSFLRHTPPATRPRALDQVLDWIQRLHRIQPVLVITGGGEAADHIRRLQPEQGWSQQKAHELAIQAMDQSAVQLAQQVPLREMPLSRFTDDAPQRWLRWDQSVRPYVLRLDQISALQPPFLPASWEVTSDSIALALTLKWQAKHLFLAKQVNPLEIAMPACKMRDLGWVDVHFPRLLTQATGCCRPDHVSPFLDVWIRHFPPSMIESCSETRENQGLVRSASLWTRILGHD